MQIKVRALTREQPRLAAATLEHGRTKMGTSDGSWARDHPRYWSIYQATTPKPRISYKYSYHPVQLIEKSKFHHVNAKIASLCPAPAVAFPTARVSPWPVFPSLVLCLVPATRQSLRRQLCVCAICAVLHSLTTTAFASPTTAQQRTGSCQLLMGTPIV